MPYSPRASITLSSAVGAVLLAAVVAGTNSNADDKPAKDPALERTRKQVRMLDDIYKGGVVLITENYVNEESDLPAGTAFKKLFEAAKQKGWHEVRLLDATGEPYNDENAPRDEFEQQAATAGTSRSSNEMANAIYGPLRRSRW